MTTPFLLCQKFLDEKFRRLWTGDISDYGGDDSRADLALCGILAREFNNDPHKVEATFNQSALAQRDKWQKRADYREHTIRKAIGSLVAVAKTKVEAVPDYRVFDLQEFLDLKIPPSEPMLGPILKEKSIDELYAWRGFGKTFVSLSMGLAVAGGGKFLKWQAPRPRRVLYLDGEMAGDEFQERLRKLKAGLGVEIPTRHFFPMNFDTQEMGLVPDIATVEGQHMVEDMIGKTEAELVILDNLSCFARIGDLDDEAWLPVASWLLSLRRKGIASLLDHHSNKNGGSRGISRREDAFNVVMKLDRPRNYRAEEGLRCDLTFEKTRGFAGENAAPLEIQLTADTGDSLVWTFRNSEEALLKQVAELLKQGMTVREIAGELKNVSKTTVGRLKTTIEERQRTEKSKGEALPEGDGLFGDG